MVSKLTLCSVRRAPWFKGYKELPEKQEHQQIGDLARAYQSVPIGLCLLDTDLRYVHINDWLAAINGLPAEEHLGRTIEEVIPEVAAGVKMQLLHVIETGEPIIDGTVDAQIPACPDEMKTFQHNYFPVTSEDGVVVGVSCSVQDITDRRKTEHALLESEEQFRSLAENSQDYIMRYDSQFRHLYENPAALRASGFTSSDIIGKTHREAGFAPQLCSLWEDKIAQVFKTGAPTREVFEWEGAEGRIYLDWRLFPEFDREGAVLSVLGVSRDITEAKRAEAELKNHRDHLEQLVIVRTGELNNILKKLKSDRAAIELEHRLLQDIIASEDAEHALRVSLLELAELLESEYAEVWIPDECAKRLRLFSQWSPPSEGTNLSTKFDVGLTLEMGQGLAGRVWSTQSLEWCCDDWQKSESPPSRVEIFNQAGYRFALGVPVQTHNRVLAIFCFFLTDPQVQNGQISELVKSVTLQAAVVIDRLHVVETLGHVLESAPGAVLLTAKDGTILQQNRACSELFGYEDSELLGNAVEVLIPERFRTGHPELRASVRDQSLPRPMGSGIELFGLKKDGTEIPIDVSLNLQETIHGNQFIIGIVDLQEHTRNLNTVRAYSKRLQSLARYLQNISESLRKSIARDLHDDFGQVLTALKMDLSMLRHRVGETVSSQEFRTFDDDFTMINETIDNALDKVTQVVTELRPDVLDSLGLVAALEWQCQEFDFRHEDIVCPFQTNRKRVAVSDNVGIVIFRVLQESLTNVARHAKASRAEVSLITSPDSLRLEIGDNGIGISNEQSSSEERFGLMGMRERVSAINGTINIETGAGRGTKITVDVPLAANRDGE